MTITLVTGVPGAGKSYYSVAEISESLLKGRCVASNVRLAEGWEYVLAKRNPLNWLSRRRREAKADDLRRRFFFSTDVEELLRVRLAGKKEGRGLMVLDECHTFLNARTWDTDDTGAGLSKADATRRRMQTVRFFSAHRHLGWEIYAITQDADNIDAQVRRNMEYHTNLKNLKKFRIAGIPLFPFNLFLAITVWNDKARSVAGRRWRLLNKSIARLYDTHALARELDEEHGSVTVLLPRPKGETTELPPGTGDPLGVRPAGAEGPRTDAALSIPGPADSPDASTLAPGQEPVVLGFPDAA